MAESPATPRTPAEWHAHIRAGRTFADAQDRMDEAFAAGVDFKALNALACGDAPDSKEPDHA
ncbi:MAG: hypothetical protein AB7R67_23730 [Vicinamibacterales bacterium]